MLARSLSTTFTFVFNFNFIIVFKLFVVLISIIFRWFSRFIVLENWSRSTVNTGHLFVEILNVDFFEIFTSRNLEVEFGLAEIFKREYL
jgi:hypothetical protein